MASLKDGNAFQGSRAFVETKIEGKERNWKELMERCNFYRENLGSLSLIRRVKKKLLDVFDVSFDG